MQTATRNRDIVAEGTFDYAYLVCMLVMLFVSYAALGKDLLTNGVDANITDDPVSKVMGHVRQFACLMSIGFVVLRFGIQASLKNMPWLYLPFVAWACLSAGWSADPYNTARNASYLLLVFFAMPMVMQKLGLLVTMRIMLYTMAAVLICSTFVALFFPAIGRHTSVVVAALHQGRWRGIFSHKNGLGPWAAFGAVFLMTHMRLVRGPRLLWIGSWMCAVVCLLLAGSATSVLAAFLLVAATTAFRYRRHVSDGIFYATVFTGLVTAGLAYEIVKSVVFPLLGRDESFSGRTEVWAVAGRHIFEHPWIGTGYLSEGGPDFLQEVLNTVLQDVPGAESSYLTSTLELGFIGLFLFYGPLLYSLKRGLDWWRVVHADQRAALEMMISIIVAALLIGATESTPFICTGYDGILTFPAVFSMAMLPPIPYMAPVRRIRDMALRQSRRAKPVPVDWGSVST